jgi:myo-inositol 2-dehydrogenase / D-chiro-inositol 1-dehydrogenase
MRDANGRQTVRASATFSHPGDDREVTYGAYAIGDRFTLLNIGLIGAGRIGRLHAQHLARRLSRARLAAIADVVEEAARQCAAEYDVGTVVSDYHLLLQSAEIDAIVVCSATDTHAQIIQEAAAARKHVFCEKPIDVTLPRIDAAIGAATRANIKLQLGFNRRFDANYRRVRTAVECGEIGRPWRLHIVSRDPAPPALAYLQSSGGLFLDMTIHDFDMARFLVGSEVDEVFATAAVLVDEAIGGLGDVDTAVTVLKFQNGAIGTIDNSRCAVYGYDQRVEILGSEGMVGTDNNYASTATVSDQHSVHRDLPLNFFMERYTQSYLDEMAAFVDCVLDDTPPLVSGEDGRVAVVLGLAAQRSYRENRPIRVADV